MIICGNNCSLAAIKEHILLEKEMELMRQHNCNMIFYDFKLNEEELNQESYKTKKWQRKTKFVSCHCIQMVYKIL